MKPFIFNAKVETCKNKAKKLKMTFHKVSNQFEHLNSFNIIAIKEVNLDGFELVIIKISDSKGGLIRLGDQDISVVLDYETDIELSNKIALIYNDDKNKGIATPEQSGNGGVVGVTSC